MKIVISKHLRLYDVPPNLRNVIMEELSFPNPKWLENERMGRWNRGTPKILRFYDTLKDGGLIIPRGYIRHLIHLCKDQQVSYEMTDRRRMLPQVDLDFQGLLKPFQKTAVDQMLAKEFGTLNAPTGSGKTVMALYMIAKRKQPALIVVHTKDLADQWLERIGEFLGISAGTVGMVGAGNKKMGGAITVAMVQTLYKCAEDIAPHIGFLVVDECHRAPSRTFTEAVACFDARYMLGLSATPWRRDKLSKLIFWHLGDLHHQVDKSHLIAKGHILAAEVILRETDFKPYYDPVREYSKVLSELTADDQRNRLIIGDVAEEVRKNGEICLILSDRKKHCETLRLLLHYNHRVPSDLLTGDLGPGQRRSVIERLNKGEIRVLIATGQLIGEGFDCRNLSTLFLATPIRFSGRLLQYLGRVMRPAPGKSRARVFDYVDINVDPLRVSAMARQRIYRTG